MIDRDMLKKFLTAETKELIDIFKKELGCREVSYFEKTSSAHGTAAASSANGESDSGSAHGTAAASSANGESDSGSWYCWYVKGSPLLIAHIDTDFKPQEPKYLGGELWQTYGRADDRAGVYTIFEIVRRTYTNISILLTSGTKRGGTAVKLFCEEAKNKGFEFLYAIEYDRKGIYDCIDYNGVNDPKFMKVFKEYYRPTIGTYSDVATIQEMLNISAINLSTGYEDSSSPQERLFLPVIERNIDLFPIILKALGNKHYPTITTP